MRRQLFENQPFLCELTPRETAVLSIARHSEPVDDIADTFHIPETIVLRHLSNIIGKLSQSDQKLAHQLLFAYNISTKD